MAPIPTLASLDDVSAEYLNDVLQRGGRWSGPGIASVRATRIGDDIGLISSAVADLTSLLNVSLSPDSPRATLAGHLAGYHAALGERGVTIDFEVLRTEYERASVLRSMAGVVLMDGEPDQGRLQTASQHLERLRVLFDLFDPLQYLD